MKNINLRMQVKAYLNNLFFNGCKWSMLITAYALIAIIIVMSSETYFSEGIYAAGVAYAIEAYDFTEKNDIQCMSSIEVRSSEPETVEQSEALSTMAFQENNIVYLKTSSKKTEENQVNVNILDSVANDASSITQKEKTARKKKAKSSQTVKEESQEAFQDTSNSTTKIKLSSSEKAVLMRIVEAEATGEDIKGKMLVANVVLNRVNNPRFPDTVEEVVFQKTGSLYQFSPIKDGRYYKVNISSETKKAVNRVLNGEDESQGALYFMSRGGAKASSVTWFDRALTKVFKYGTHEFYK